MSQCSLEATASFLVVFKSFSCPWRAKLPNNNPNTVAKKCTTFFACKTIFGSLLARKFTDWHKKKKTPNFLSRMRQNLYFPFTQRSSEKWKDENNWLKLCLDLDSTDWNLNDYTKSKKNCYISYCSHKFITLYVLQTLNVFHMKLSIRGPGIRCMLCCLCYFFSNLNCRLRRPLPFFAGIEILALWLRDQRSSLVPGTEEGVRTWSTNIVNTTYSCCVIISIASVNEFYQIEFYVKYTSVQTIIVGSYKGNEINVDFC